MTPMFEQVKTFPALDCTARVIGKRNTPFHVLLSGLYGNNGVLPARIQLDSKAKTLSARIHTKPTLLWLAPYIGLDTEYMMDVLALLGVFLAFTG
jgi:hypothetical protein